MKKRRIAFVLVGIMLTMALVGCNASNKEVSSDRYEIGLVTATGSIDDKSFNQGAWEGLKEYAEANDISYKYYRSKDQSVTSIEEAMELAVLGGAMIVVCPGYLFEVPVYDMQMKYPGVTFIQLDGAPTDANGNQMIGNNVLAYNYAEEQAGFLAGYAATMDGYRKLGFMGGIAVPNVVRYGYGFVQGAEYAAKVLGLAKGDVEMKYTYVGNFDASPDNTVKASSWYNTGTEVIFACGGSVGNSVMSAAETNGKKVIGVDVDQSSESDTVITSAVKNIKKTVYDAIEGCYNNTVTPGTLTKLDVSTQAILLPMDTSRFVQFTKQQYEEIYKDLTAGTITILKDSDVQSVAQLPVEITQINQVQ